ncbi:MAG: hypothetical protein ACOH2M_13765 [Cypionkella sp.]
MSFREQVTWCRIWGLAMVPVLILMIGGAAVTPHRLSHMLNVLSLLVLGEIALLVVIGGVLRPINKAFYHRFSEHVPLFRSIASLPLLRHWLWLTPNGKDRDA